VLYKLFSQLQFPEQHLLRRSVHLYIPDGAMKESRLKYPSTVNICWILFISFAMLTSCIRNQNETKVDYNGFLEKQFLLIGSKKQSYTLNDTLCRISIKIPARLDTFYTWEDHSDYTDAMYLKYRFSDRQYDQYAESGFFYSFKPKSLYQLTLWHKRYKQVPDSIKLKPFTENQKNDKWFHQVPILSYDDIVQYLSTEYKEIDKRPFILSAFISKHSYLTNKEALFVTAATNLTDRYIFFIAECEIKDSTGFINNMYKSLLSIKIEEK
jgi:hypothetical protein